MTDDVKAAIKQMDAPRGKWRNVRTACNQGHRHASKREANRCNELTLLEKGKEIFQLQQQPRYPLEVNGILICTYVADFKYFEAHGKGRLVVEDSKGAITPEFRIKRKLMQAIYGIEVTLT